MSDKYPDFETLSQHEISGVDYRILVRRATTSFSIVAIHGGGIEPGASELADAVAGSEFSFYAFEGLKRSGNADLHITSTKMDEPMCVGLLRVTGTVVTIHGEGTDVDGEGVFLGGLDDETGGRFREALEGNGFCVRRHPNPELQGREPTNVCNRGTLGKGVQLELSRAVRKEMFASLSRDGRTHPTPRFYSFVDALRNVLESPLSEAVAGSGACR
jgi:phage replication-related protein YjqB (UPF0714/DUF867 family)